MNIKRKSKRLRHITFNLIDLACLIVSFFIAYYVKFNTLNIFVRMEWPILLAIICIINVMTSIIERTYIGILKRGYYQQFDKEWLLFWTQFAAICMLLYSFKYGELYSRQTVLLTYFLYFISSQPLKYLRKKFLAREASFEKKEVEIVDLNDSDDNKKLKYIENKNKVIKKSTLFVKRIIDIFAGIVGIIILIPLTLIIFIVNKISRDDDGPVFYKQERIGKNGKKFKILKYRSMVIDADEKLKQFLEENEDIREEFEINRKIKNDPRITYVGKILRKTSLDEFPQFINVIKGEMSLVGPRAVVEDELEMFGPYKKYVYSVKPGITGNWAANGRSDTSYDERVELECQYFNDFSILNDIKIIFKTIVSVIKKEGAI